MKLHINRKIFLALFISYNLLLINLSHAQSAYPANPVEMIVPWGPGGGADTIGRITARWLEKDFNMPFTVLNMPGATGSIGLNRMILNGSKGYSIGVMTGDTLSLDAFPNSQFKLTETIPLAVMIRQPSGLFAKFDGPFKSWDDVITAAKINPGSINVAITGPNSPDEATVNYLDSKGIKLVSIPYTKPSDRYVSVLGGQVELLYEQAGDIKSHIDAKKIRPLIFFATKRLPPPFAEIPVSVEYGYDILLPQTRSIIAKKGVDANILAALSDSLNRFAASPEYIAYLKDQYALPDSYIPMKDAQVFLNNELISFKAVVGPSVKQ